MSAAQPDEAMIVVVMVVGETDQVGAADCYEMGSEQIAALRDYLGAPTWVGMTPLESGDSTVIMDGPNA